MSNIPTNIMMLLLKKSVPKDAKTVSLQNHSILNFFRVLFLN